MIIKFLVCECILELANFMLNMLLIFKQGFFVLKFFPISVELTLTLSQDIFLTRKAFLISQYWSEGHRLKENLIYRWEDEEANSTFYFTLLFFWEIVGFCILYIRFRIKLCPSPGTAYHAIHSLHYN